MALRIFLIVGLAASIQAQAPLDTHAPVPLQPLAQHVRRLETALAYLGQPLLETDQTEINAAIADTDEIAAVNRLERVLDKYTLAIVEINPESRVKVDQGTAKPDLVEGGTRLFLVKILNQARVTAPLKVSSPSSGNVYITSNGAPAPPLKLRPKDAQDKWASVSIYDKPPMARRLSGLGLEYQILEIQSRDSGQRSAVLQFDVGQTSRDVGFRSEILVLFNAEPAHAHHAADSRFERPAVRRFAPGERSLQSHLPESLQTPCPGFLRFNRRSIASMAKRFGCRRAITQSRTPAVRNT